MPEEKIDFHSVHFLLVVYLLRISSKILRYFQNKDLGSHLQSFLDIYAICAQFKEISASDSFE